MKSTTGFIARLMFGLPMAVFGVFHFINAQQMAGYVWLPGGVFWVYLTGIALILAAISLITNQYSLYAAYGMAIFLFFTTFTVHLPNWIGGNQMSLFQFLKDMVILGGALFLIDKLQEDPQAIG